MDWIKHFSIGYFLRLVGLTIVLNYFSIGYHGIISPEGARYSPFLDNYLNYIQWIRELLMYGSNFIANTLGTSSYIIGSQMISIGNFITVEIWLPCLGIGVMSFWTAFIVTNTGSVKTKMTWWIGGILSIYVINCWRIALFLIALDRGWSQNTSFDHHDMFNVAAYILIGILMYSYTEGKREPDTHKGIVQPAN